MSTVKDTVLNVDKFVRRNLGGGVDHLIVFLDGEQPDVEEFLSASPHATCVTTHHDWWHGQRQIELNDRQRTHATLAARMLSRFSWVQWMFHIDGDEVVHIDRDVLTSHRADVRGVHLAPLEAVAQLHATRDPTLFKPLLDDNQLRQLTRMGVIRRPHNRAFFRGHTAGKVGVRPASDIRVGIHSATDAEERTIPAVKDATFNVLHYESPNGEQSLRKWKALLTSGDSVDQGADRRNLARRVRRLLDSGLPTREFQAALEDLYTQHVADDVETLHRLGVLLEEDPDSWFRTPEPFPADAASPWLAAIEDMRHTRKSLVLPPARRNAPIDAV